MKNIKALITYNENCNYKKSITQTELTLPLRKINIDFLYTEHPYYNNPIDIIILIQDYQTLNPIGYGSVNFYYINDNDINEEKNKINETPINIDRYGNALIQYMPHSSGRLIVEYYGSPYYETTIKEEYIQLYPQPTHIKFNHTSPYLVNPNETVKLDVTVTDNNNELIDYGLVTFLNYHTYDIDDPDYGYEKVIGNPSYLINGEASINYSPIQDNTNQKLGNIELIRATYNYNNNIYGSNWHYYQQSSDYTAIAVRKENNINILVPKIHKTNGNKEIKVLENGMFIANENNNILLQCEVTIDENTIIDNANVVFVIQGKEKREENGNTIEVNYEETIQADFIEEINCFQSNRLVLPQGLYKIYALVNDPILNDEEIPIIEDIESITPNSNVHDELIIDGIYLQNNRSANYYIQIEPESNDVSLTLSTSQSIITNQTLNKNNLNVTIDIENSDECDIFNMLNEIESYFVIPKLSSTEFEGEIINNNGTLTIRPQNDIYIENIGNYSIYAYIQEKICTCNNTKRKYYTTYSNEITIKNRNPLDVELELVSENNNYHYPSNIKYKINIDNIYIDTIDVDIYVDNNYVCTHNLSSKYSSVIDSLPIQNVGEHTIYAQVSTPGYNNFRSTTLNFTIYKSQLGIYLNDYKDENFSIYSGTNSLISFDIINQSNPNKINNLNKNNFIICIKKKYRNEDDSENPIDIEYTQSPLSFDIENINNKYYKLNINTLLFDNGEWEINIKYLNDNNYEDYIGDNTYESINDVFTTFYVENKNANCINICENNEIKNQIVYAESSFEIDQKDNIPVLKERRNFYPINQYILVTSIIYDEQSYDSTNETYSSFITLTHITDINGKYKINKPASIISDSIWYNRYITTDYSIDPKNDILTSFKESDLNDDNDSTIISNFRTYFTDYQGTDNDIINLYNQAKEYHFVNLFLGYDVSGDRIALSKECGTIHNDEVLSKIDLTADIVLNIVDESIEGSNIYDDTDYTIDQATVILTPTNGDPIPPKESENGECIFADMIPGEYSIEVSCNDYETYFGSINIEYGMNQIEIKMIKEE